MEGMTVAKNEKYSDEDLYQYQKPNNNEHTVTGESSE